MLLKSINTERMGNTTDSHGTELGYGVSLNVTGALTKFSVPGCGHYLLLKNQSASYAANMFTDIVYLGDYEGNKPTDAFNLWGAQVSGVRTQPFINLDVSGFRQGWEGNENLEVCVFSSCEFVGTTNNFTLGVECNKGLNNQFVAGAEDTVAISWNGEVCSFGSVTEVIVLPKELEERLEHLLLLPEKWDSYDASRISNVAVRKVKSMLTDAFTYSSETIIGEVFIAPCPDGGLQLEWDFNSDKELILIIPPSSAPVRFSLGVNAESGEYTEKNGSLETSADWISLLSELIIMEN